MLTRFEVKGFKSLVDVAVDLGAVNVFIGANGSGKSNLLEALGFLGAVASIGPRLEAFQYRGLRDSRPSSILCSLKGQQTHTLQLVASDQHCQYYTALSGHGSEDEWETKFEFIKINQQLIAERSGDEVFLYVPLNNFSNLHSTPAHGIPLRVKLSGTLNNLYESFASIGLHLANDPVRRIDADYSESYYGPEYYPPFIDLIANYQIYTPFTLQLRGFPGNFQRNALGLDGSGLGRAIEEMRATHSEKLGPFDVDEVLDLIEWANHIGTNAEENGTSSKAPIRLEIGDRFMAGTHKTITAAETSEGALYVLFLLALVGHERSPKMFAVDNFDQALHPRLARALTEMICDQILADGTRQMFATTHNPLVLNGLNLRDDRIRLFTVDRDETGASQVKRVMVSDKLMHQAESGHPLSELWTSGWLGGGLPKNY